MTSKSNIMKREELRKVKITDYMSEFKGQEGYFNTWEVFGSYNDHIEAYGIVELESGQCVCIKAYDIKFINN